MLNSVSWEFKNSAWAIGLHIGSNASALTFLFFRNSYRLLWKTTGLTDHRYHIKALGCKKICHNTRLFSQSPAKCQSYFFINPFFYKIPLFLLISAIGNSLPLRSQNNLHKIRDFPLRHISHKPHPFFLFPA